MARYPHIVGTVILGVVLLVPYVLKLQNPMLEPYPAVILPSGAGVISTGEGRVSFTQRALYGIDATTGQERRLEARSLLDPIPEHYLDALARRGFGIGDPPKERLRIAWLDTIWNFDRPEFTLEQHAEARAWFGTRLRTLGCRDEVLITRLLRIRWSVATRAVIYSRVLRERIIRLR
jgi:hypothetical protein